MGLWRISAGVSRVQGCPHAHGSHKCPFPRQQHFISDQYNNVSSYRLLSLTLTQIMSSALFSPQLINIIYSILCIVKKQLPQPKPIYRSCRPSFDASLLRPTRTRTRSRKVSACSLGTTTLRLWICRQKSTFLSARNSSTRMHCPSSIRAATCTISSTPGSSSRSRGSWSGGCYI